MYRKNTGFGGTGPGYSTYNDGSSVVEAENDRLEDELKNKIRTLKVLSIDIGDEVRDHNKFLKDMDNDFDSAGGFLGKAMGRVKKLTKGSQNYVILYLFLFALFVFLLIWLIIKF